MDINHMIDQGNQNFIIITTINAPTEGIIKFAKEPGFKLIIIGDRKTPIDYESLHDSGELSFLSLNFQNRNEFQLCKHIPLDHYGRKNFGYLDAIKRGASIIAESDDDNIPYEDWRKQFQLGWVPNAKKIVGEGAFNVYKLFTDTHIWPRGFPLNLINQEDLIEIKDQGASVFIWQGLADGEPDVDAIFRLVYGEKLTFNKLREPIILSRGVYCPFNSQNTFWIKDAFPFLYLPMSVSFRFTDILRGYIAQRCIWELDGRLAFGNASVFQDRNIHNLMNDFESEIECYKRVNDVIDILKNCRLSGSPGRDLQKIYHALFDANIVLEWELEAVECWIKDLRNLGIIKVSGTLP